jgi:hypothetical protein
MPNVKNNFIARNLRVEIVICQRWAFPNNSYHFVSEFTLWFRSIIDICSNETFSNLINVIFSNGAWASPLLIRPLGLLTQAFQLGILITFVNTFCFNYHCKCCNVCVFYFRMFSTKLDLFEATCSITYFTRLSFKMLQDFMQVCQIKTTILLRR